MVRASHPPGIACLFASLAGRDEGIVISDFERGAMLQRAREGELDDVLVTSGVEAAEGARYASTMTLVH